MKKLVCAIALVLTSGIASGAGAGGGPNPYSDCGIGAAIFENNTGAAISNVIWDLGTTAVVSATSSPETCEGASVVAAEMIFETYVNLELDTARGEGANLTALMDVLQCSADARPQISADLRTSFSDLVNDDSYTSKTRVEKSSDYYDALQSAAAGHCATS